MKLRSAIKRCSRRKRKGIKPKFLRPNALTSTKIPTTHSPKRKKKVVVYKRNKDNSSDSSIDNIILMLSDEDHLNEPATMSSSSSSSPSEYSNSSESSVYSLKPTNTSNDDKEKGTMASPPTKDPVNKNSLTPQTVTSPTSYHTTGGTQQAMSQHNAYASMNPYSSIMMQNHQPYHQPMTGCIDFFPPVGFQQQATRFYPPAPPHTTNHTNNSSIGFLSSPPRTNPTSQTPASSLLVTPQPENPSIRQESTQEQESSSSKASHVETGFINPNMMPENTGEDMFSTSTDGDRMYSTKNYPEEVPEYIVENKLPKGMTQRQVNKKRMDFICKYDFDDVVLTQDGRGVYSIGPLIYSKNQIRCDLMVAFLRKNNQKVSDVRNRKEYCRNMIVHITKIRGNGGLKKENIKKSVQNKTGGVSSSITKPSFLTKDGTLFRVVNVITSEEGRKLLVRTRQNFTRKQLDTGTFPYSDVWTGMHALYEDYKRFGILATARNCLTGTGVDSNVACLDTDKTTVVEFKRIVEYVMAHYKKARNNKNKSGHNKPFSNFVHKKWWLLYLHYLLEEIGNRSLSDTFYMELPKNVLATSDNPGIDNSDDDSSVADKKAMKDSSKKRKLVKDLNSKKKKLISIKTNSLAAIETRNRTLTYTTSCARIDCLEKALYEHEKERRKTKITMRKLKKKIELKTDIDEEDPNYSDHDSDEEELIELEERQKYLDRVIGSKHEQLSILKESIGATNKKEKKNNNVEIETYE